MIRFFALQVLVRGDGSAGDSYRYSIDPIASSDTSLSFAPGASQTRGSRGCPCWLNRKDARLKDLQAEIERCLKAVGYEFVVADDNPLARDKHRYYCLAVSYEASFKDISAALRPELKLELIHRPPLLPVANKGMKSLFGQRIPTDEPVFSVPCISVAETLAEKVLSLFRCCAWLWGGCQRGEFDTALVRHIYDVWMIPTSMPEALPEAERVFLALVEKDVEEFRGQCPGFDARPFEVLRETLEDPRMTTELREHFERRLLPLLFSEEMPAFEECFAHFASVARRLLATG